jgi:hypothetical protein
MAMVRGLGGMRRALGAGVLAVVVLGGGAPAGAGSLTATAPPDATAPAPMPTLDDIYYRLFDGSATASAPGSLTKRTSGGFVDPDAISGTGTMHSLADILGVAPLAATADADRAAASDVCSGQKYFGLRTGAWGAGQTGGRDCTAPTFADPGAQTTAEDTAKVVALTASDAVTPAASLTWQGDSTNRTLLPLGGIALAYSSGWSATLTPAANQAGTTDVTLTVRDAAGNARTRTFTLTVTPANDPPVAVADRYTVSPGGVLTVAAANGVLANDSDPEGQAITVETPSACTPANGTLSLNANGSFTYTNDGSTGTDSCTYTVQDASSASATATLSFAVASMNTAPTLSLPAPAGDCRIGGVGTCTENITTGGGGGATVGDTTGALAWMKVEVTANKIAGDALKMSSAPGSGLGEAYTAGGALYVAGNATASAYQSALRDVQFQATTVGSPRTITVTVSDGLLTTSDAVTMTVAP